MTRSDVGWYKTSESYTDHLFREAVITIKGTRCSVCGSVCQQVHVHHIIPRGYELTRWDIRNGAVVCESCHLNSVHGAGWNKYLLEYSEYSEFLTDAKATMFPDFLVSIGKTREEFHEERRAILKAIIKSNQTSSCQILQRSMV